MKIKVDSNAQEIAESLRKDIEEFQKKLEFQVFQGLSVLEKHIVDNIRNKSGLHVRSGSLLNSITASKRVEVNSSGHVEGSIGPEGIPYAAIHEFGGKTSAHEIRPRLSSSLKFNIGGRDVFAKRVMHPGSNIPARPYLRPAIEQSRQELIENFGLFIKAVFLKD